MCEMPIAFKRHLTLSAHASRVNTPRIATLHVQTTPCVLSIYI